MTQRLHPRSAAQGLASLGRHGDSTLVHMSPKEVQGLQNLAMRHGTSLTINPHTGMPEAFSLSRLLPALGGLALGVINPALLPYAAAAAGGVTKASGGSWEDAISTGLQVYGGGQLGAGITAAGAGAAPTEALASQTAAQAAPEATAQMTSNLAANPAVESTVAPDLSSAATNNAQYVGYQEGQVAPSLTAGDPGVAKAGMGFNTSGTPQGFGWDEGINPETGQLTADTAQRLASAPGAPIASETPAPTAYENFEKGLGEWVKPKGDVTTSEVFKDVGLPGKLGLTAAAVEAGKEEPPQIEEKKPVYYIRKEGGPALYEQGKVNPIIAEKGYLPAGQPYYIGQKFNEGVYSYSPTKYEPVEGMRRGGLASLTKYDGGGAVPQNVGQKMLAAQPTPAAQPTSSQNALQGMNQFYANQLQASQTPAAPPSGQGLTDWIAAYNQKVTPETTAPVTPAEDVAPPSTTNTPATTSAASNPFADTRISKAEAQKLYDADKAAFTKRLEDNYKSTLPSYQRRNIRSMPREYQALDDYWVAANPMGEGKYAYRAEDTGSLPAAWGMAAGGLANLGGTYKAGGKLLRGPGDGMSDSIPAVIGGHKPQRAALADGEFVVPADVVSHLGNGSTEAGSRKLYAMMDKVRHARTGSKKQAKAIKAERFMPK